MSALQGQDDERVLDQFHAFPFSSDETFQGLSGILVHESTNDMSDDERLELVLKTKLFYFNRITGHELSLEDVQGLQATHAADLNPFSGNERNQISISSGEEHGEMRMLTFAELGMLIEQGKTDNIPNNKIIPNMLSDGVPSESTTPLRRKPWEVV